MRAIVLSLAVAVCMQCAGCRGRGSGVTGPFGDAQYGVRIALRVPDRVVRQGEKIQLTVVLENTSAEPVVIAGSPYVDIGVNVNGRPDVGVSRVVELARTDIKLEPATRSIYAVRILDTSKWSGTCELSGGVYLFGNQEPPVPVGKLSILVK